MINLAWMTSMFILKLQLLHFQWINKPYNHLIKYNICKPFKWLIHAKHINIWSIMHLVCEKHKRSSFSTFWKFEAVANTGVSQGMFLWLTSTRPETWPCARSCLACRILKTCYFQVVTYTTKVTTLATIKIFNYNICNTHFNHSNNSQMITTLVTKAMLQTP